MTKEFELYHGAVFTRIVHGAGRMVSLEPFPSRSNASYVLNGVVGLYIKHSTKRVSPWSYTFLRAHQDEIAKMHVAFGEVFTALVCRDDGIALLNFEELKQILDSNHDESEWVRVVRSRRRQYEVSGSNGELQFKVSQQSCPDKILEYFGLHDKSSTR